MLSNVASSYNAYFFFFSGIIDQSRSSLKSFYTVFRSYLLMSKRILILGAGFGGLAAATELRKSLGSDHRVIVVDRKKSFMMGLVKLWILEGSRVLEESQTPLDGQNAKGIEYLNDEVTKIKTAQNREQ